MVNVPIKLTRRRVSSPVVVPVKAGSIPYPTATSLARIFLSTATVRLDAATPDREYTLLGAYTSTMVFVLDYPGLATPLVVLPAGAGTPLAQRGTTWATLVIPASVPMERLRCWVVDGATAYAPVYLNRATPTHADSDRFSPGYGGVVHGKNLLLTPGVSKVYLKDTQSGQVLTDSVINWSLSGDKRLFVNYSASAAVGRSYYPGVSNGLGKDASGLDDVVYLTSTLTCIPGCPDYFNLAQHWISHRGIYYQGDKVIDVTTANATDDISNALQAAMSQAAAFTGRASGLPGAVVRVMSNSVLTKANVPDHVIVTTGPGVQVTSPTGSDPTPAGQQITPLLAPGATLAGWVNFNWKNLADTSTATPYRNPVMYGGTDMLVANCSLDLGEGRWLEATGMKGMTWVGNTVHQGIAQHASPVRGGVVFDSGNHVIYRNNVLNFAVDCVSMLGCTNSSAGGNAYNWDYTAGNGFLGANHSLAVGGCRRLAVFNEVFTLLGTKDMQAKKVAGDQAGKRANDGEQVIAEITQNGSYYHCDFVGAATASTFSGPDLSNSLGAYVRLIAGTGVFQERVIVGLSGNVATLDRPWDVLPDSTSRYVTDFMGADDFSVSDCQFKYGKRGILCYLSAMRNCDFTNNTFPSGSGIDCSPLSAKGAQRPMWSVFMDGNSLDSSTDTANATRIGMHTLISDTLTPFGTLAANVTMRRNALSASDPSLVVLIDDPYGSGLDFGVTYQGFGYGHYQPSATTPVQLGLIASNNSVRQCAFGVRTTQGVTGVYVRNLYTQGLTTTHLDQLYDGNIAGAVGYLETGTTAFTGAAVPGLGWVPPAAAAASPYVAATTKAYPAASSYAASTENAVNGVSPLTVRNSVAAYNTGASSYLVQKRVFRNDSGWVADIYMPNGELIVIDQCVFLSASANDLIHITDNSRVKITNCLFICDGTQPTGTKRGRAVYSYAASNVEVDNCYMLNTAGVKVDKWNANGGAGTVKILRNRFDNICGGSGDYCQAVQLADVQAVAGLEIAWNQVVNTPGLSRVEDIVNIEESSGTAASRASIHDNFLQGAYPANPTDGGFTGSGITLEASGSQNPVSAMPAYWDVTNNIIVATMNAAVNFTAGLHNRATGNYVVVCGKDSGGNQLNGVNNALGLFNNSGYSNAQMDDNAITGNEVHINTANGEHALYNNGDTGPSSVLITTGNNTFVDGATFADEQGAFAKWQDKLAANQVLIGA